jgi:hypothetical protein
VRDLAGSADGRDARHWMAPLGADEVALASTRSSGGAHEGDRDRAGAVVVRGIASRGAERR